MPFPINEKRGLWDNIHAKRRRIKAGSGEKMRKPGSDGAPTEEALKQSQTEENLFDLVYDFLISEDLDEQDVLAIMARVPIEEILEVIEEDADWKKRNFRPLPDNSVKNVVKTLGKFVSDVKTQKARPLSRFRPGVRRQIKKRKTQLSNMLHAINSKKKDVEARMAEFDDNVNASNTIKRFQREEFILEYLLSYGYADSYDAAVEIYESMSDEWLYDILEEF